MMSLSRITTNMGNRLFPVYDVDNYIKKDLSGKELTGTNLTLVELGDTNLSCAVMPDVTIHP